MILPICLATIAALPVWRGPQVEGREAEPPQAPAPVEVRWIANAGFLITAGETKVLIDAFLGESAYGYGALAPGDLEDLVHARGVFAGIDVALASHHHRDHFQAKVARRFLAAASGCVLASSPMVITALLADGDAGGMPEGRTRQVYPLRGEEQALEVEGLRIEFLNLPHGTQQDDHEQNMGHLITLAGFRVLHLGDAAMSADSFAAYGLAQRGIDVVLVPYWFFDHEEGRQVVAAHLRPARLVACHIPPGEQADVALRLAQEFPDVLVPQRSLQVVPVSTAPEPVEPAQR
jgi:L-ascorbate metabolism protein UlaG (beta-lactamase superfamily)